MNKQQTPMNTPEKNRYKRTLEALHVPATAPDKYGYHYHRRATELCEYGDTIVVHYRYRFNLTHALGHKQHAEIWWLNWDEDPDSDWQHVTVTPDRPVD